LSCQRFFLLAFSSASKSVAFVRKFKYLRMADAVDTTNVAESVPEVPAEVVSKETITDPEAGDVESISSEAEKTEVPVVVAEEKAEENGKAEIAEPELPKENGSTPKKDDKVSENGSGTNGDDTEERKRKPEALEASLEDTEVSAEKKAKLEEKSEVKQDEVENSSNGGEAEVAA
jgi:hypothetical protein